MCGIAGFALHSRTGDNASILSQLEPMARAIEHRGPDDRGYFAQPNSGIGLAHVRLAILDLSPEGHQPMVSPSKRFTLVFNGEIFNFLELKDLLVHQGYSFRGGSDTEVMLAGFEYWGVEEAVSRFIGMFSFALWDEDQKALWLVRDRLGKKPLYYGWTEEGLIFGSELKALVAHRSFKRAINVDAAKMSLAYGFIPGPWTIYQGIFKLPGAHLLRLSDSQLTSMPSDFTPHPTRNVPQSYLHCYWDARAFVPEDYRETTTIPLSSQIDSLDELLHESVKCRMISDVPLGAFLSGGIDSSVVVAIMQSLHSQPIKTFTIAFDNADYNEASFAKDISKHLGTDHTELAVDEKMLLETIPELPWLYDEPFADSSQIPTLVVSRLARRSVTVALSGDGGDEVFGGYNRYLWPEKLYNRIRLLPYPLRRVAASLLESLPSSAAKLLCSPFSALVNRPEERLAKLGSVLQSRNLRDLYLSLMQTGPGGKLLASDPLPKELEQLFDLGFLRGAMLADRLYYLPDDNLVKVDRASMRVALEVRNPLLDQRVVQFASQLPDHALIQGRVNKWILRQVLYRYVPKELIDRPKMGFSVPIGEWLKGPLKSWASDLLSPARLSSSPIIDQQTTLRLWNEHLSGKKNHQHALWNILMFQAWQARWVNV